MKWGFLSIIFIAFVGLFFLQESKASQQFPKFCNAEDSRKDVYINVDLANELSTSDGDQLYIFEDSVGLAHTDSHGRVPFENSYEWWFARNWISQWMPLCGIPKFTTDPMVEKNKLSSYFHLEDRSSEATKRKGIQIALRTYSGYYGLYTYEGRLKDGTAPGLWEKAKIVNLDEPGTRPGAVWGGP